MFEETFSNAKGGRAKERETHSKHSEVFAGLARKKISVEEESRRESKVRKPNGNNYCWRILNTKGQERDEKPKTRKRSHQRVEVPQEVFGKEISIQDVW